MDDKKLVDIGKRIKAIRISKGMTMEDFGDELSPKASKGTISKWENGKYLPNNERLNQIAKIGDVSIPYLLEGDYVMRASDRLLTSEKNGALAADLKPSAIITDDFANKLFEQATQSFSNSFDDKFIKTEVALFLKSLVSINNGEIPDEKLEKELNTISFEIAKLPFEIAKKKK